MKLIRVECPGRLPDLHDHIHDLWFDLEEVLGQEGESRTFRLWRSLKDFAAEPTYLTIHNVTADEVLDSERIGFYDINNLSYKAGKLTVLTGVPLILSFTVRTLSVEVRHYVPSTVGKSVDG